MHELKRSLSASETRAGEIHAHARNLEATRREESAVSSLCVTCPANSARAPVFRLSFYRRS